MRVRQLDVLRAIAIFLVLGRHLPDWPAASGPAWTAGLEVWRRSGWIGVDLFFVLSGFLISGLLFHEHRRHGQIHFGRFFVRRAFKIYPAFYVMIAATVAVRLARGDGVAPTGLVSEMVFAQNYWRSLWPHTWSLAVEEHFYVLLPLALIALARLRRGARDPFAPLIGIFVVVATALLGLRVLVARSGPFASKTHLYATHLRIDSLLFGVLISYFHHYRGERLSGVIRGRHWWLLAGGIALAMPSAALRVEASFFMPTAGLTLLYLGFGAILLASLEWPYGGGALRERVVSSLAAIGFYSYSIYLWHVAVGSWGVRGLAEMLGARPPLVIELVAYVAGSLAVGVVMAKVVERPFLRLRDRAFPTRSPAI